MEDTVRVVTARYADLAAITRSPHRTAITMVPFREGAAPVRWARSDQEKDQIGLHIGVGSWWLDATLDNPGYCSHAHAALAQDDKIL